ncbi:MAG: signal recognition particle-docking protein FtsY [Acidilobaceae archaeon]|nr:signal recognition particle-docking protein FtsY [Acidilobaceae archaeon]MDW7973946.1 signal recognition particle-docking protein FtsY [Sulfolobales archaeon]
MVFDLLRNAFSALADKVKYRNISEEELRGVLEELVMDMVAADVALEVAEGIAQRVQKELTGAKVARGESADKLIIAAVRKKMLSHFKPAPELVSSVRQKCSRKEPYVILFFGINGVGKTTTIAKVAQKLKKEGIGVVIAAADTFRAGAQEQLEVHARRVGVPILKGRYGSDPASVAHDAIEHARAKGICAVLVDTAGRMHVDKDLLEEMRKIVRIAKPDLRVLVVDALTGNDAVEQARSFNEHIGIDAVIVSKADADVKGGTILSVAYVTEKPILFLGTGQSYDDLEQFSPESYVDTILGLRAL